MVPVGGNDQLSAVLDHHSLNLMPRPDSFIIRRMVKLYLNFAESVVPPIGNTTMSGKYSAYETRLCDAGM